jgi:hypothetical protein
LGAAIVEGVEEANTPAAGGFAAGAGMEVEPMGAGVPPVAGFATGAAGAAGFCSPSFSRMVLKMLISDPFRMVGWAELRTNTISIRYMSIYIGFVTASSQLP